MNDVIRSLALAADSEKPRSERARAAAEIVRDARSYRWVGIYDAGDEEVALIAQTGTAALDEAARTQAAVISENIVVPVLGAESAIVIGTLNVENDRAHAFSDADIAFLEECAAVLRPLYD
jgi:putative methionine-R-sulfoxide reductase with GAF domain